MHAWMDGWMERHGMAWHDGDRLRTDGINAVHAHGATLRVCFLFLFLLFSCLCVSKGAHRSLAHAPSGCLTCVIGTSRGRRVSPPHQASVRTAEETRIAAEKREAALEATCEGLRRTVEEARRENRRIREEAEEERRQADDRIGRARQEHDAAVHALR